MDYTLTASDEKSERGDERCDFDDNEIQYFSDHESSGFLEHSEFDGQSDQPVDLKQYLKRPTIYSRIVAAFNALTCVNVKRFLQWLMDKARLKFEISVSIALVLSLHIAAVLTNTFRVYQIEDVTLLMTIFVLFGEDIELLAAPSTDGKRTLFRTICYFSTIL